MKHQKRSEAKQVKKWIKRERTCKLERKVITCLISSNFVSTTIFHGRSFSSEWGTQIVRISARVTSTFKKCHVCVWGFHTSSSSDKKKPLLRSAYYKTKKFFDLFYPFILLRNVSFIERELHLGGIQTAIIQLAPIKEQDSERFMWSVASITYYIWLSFADRSVNL